MVVAGQYIQKSREVYSGTDAVIPLPELGIELPLAEIYEGAEFAPEEDESEDPPS